MKINNLLILTLLLIAAGCSPQKRHPLQSNQAASGDWTLPYDEWNFAFITPRELPSMVNHARVIDTDGYLYTFNTLDPTFWDNSINEWPEYAHGYGVHFNKVKNPPSTLSSAGIPILTSKPTKPAPYSGPKPGCA
jgi:hypothetical protein